MHRDIWAVPFGNAKAAMTAEAASRVNPNRLLPADRDHNFVQVPFVGGLRSITPDLGRNWCSNFRYQISDRLMADRNVAFCRQLLNVPQVAVETVVGLDGKPTTGLS